MVLVIDRDVHEVVSHLGEGSCSLEEPRPEAVDVRREVEMGTRWFIVKFPIGW